jgi:O-antigen/teichoic acid export membrane protein
MATGTVAAAGLGFVYWWLAARLFPPEVIGNTSALLSVMGLIGTLGEAGLGTMLVGEIVRNPGRERGLVAAALCFGVALGVGLALLFVFGHAYFGSPTELIGDWFVGVVFVLGCGLTVFAILADQAFLGTLRATGRMIRQVLFCTLKLMLIATAAVGGYTSHTALILTWVAGLLGSIIGVDLLTRGGGRRLVGPPDFQLLHTLRGKVFDHYVLDVALQAPGIIMPYVVLVLLSPAVNAAFVSLWMLVTIASLIPAAMATVLFPVVRASPKQSRHDILVSVTASLLFSLVCAVFIFTYSQNILAVFNPAYADIAGSSLRFLGFSLLGTALKFHACTLARLGDRMRKASRWFALGGLLELGLVIAGARLGGLEGLVLGWTLATTIEGACAALTLAFAMKSDSAAGLVHEESPPSPLHT